MHFVTKQLFTSTFLNEKSLTVVMTTTELTRRTANQSPFQRHLTGFCPEFVFLLFKVENLSEGYKINTPLLACWYIEGQCPRIRDGPQNITFALEASLLGQMFIFRTISNPRTLSFDIPAARRGVFIK